MKRTGIECRIPLRQGKLLWFPNGVFSPGKLSLRTRSSLTLQLSLSLSPSLSLYPSLSLSRSPSPSLSLSLFLSPSLLLFWPKNEEPPKKNKDFPLCRSLKILGKEGENAQKGKDNRKTKISRIWDLRTSSSQPKVRLRFCLAGTAWALGKRKHTPPCSSAELLSAEEKWGPQRKDLGGGNGFLVFIGFLYPPPAWKVFFEARKVLQKIFFR